MFIVTENAALKTVKFEHKCCCFDTDNLLRFTKLVKCILNFSFFTVFFKNRNIISKIKRSKTTDYAALIIWSC